MAHPVIDRPHTVSSYNQQLSQVSAIINRMTDMARALLAGGLDALQNADAVAAMQIVADDKAIDELERQLEQLALMTIMSRAPMAEDLRYLIAAIRVGKMLERTGDQAKRIARRLDTVDRAALGPRFAQVRAMERYASAMLAKAIESFNTASHALALEVIADDAGLNAMNARLIESCSAGIDDGSLASGDAIQLILMGKQLERVGDYASNIAGDVSYMLTGQ
ncbi:MAG: phosphate signaling complex protein PhoU [Erythrobacter sp.]|jgi:phosphate transport system protein|nr:phosphate signaling complex protein PhoU [Erythrobacter sp.]